MCSVCIQNDLLKTLTPGVCPGVLDVDSNDMLYDDIEGCEDIHVRVNFSNEEIEPAPLENCGRSSPNCGYDDVDDDETEVIADSFDSDNICDLNDERGTPAQDQSADNSSLVEFCIKFLVYFQLKFHLPERGLQLLIFFLSLFVEFFVDLTRMEF